MDLRAEARRLAPELPALPQLRAMARETWRGRMVNEHSSAAVFEGLARQLGAAGLEPESVAACRAFADEERRHGVLCGAVVEALGGEARFEPRRDPAFPEHEDAPPAEAALRNLLSISCLSETVAVALIGAERLEMPAGPLRALLTRIYADEVGHARFGWVLAPRLVAALDAAGRERTGAYLAVALAALERHELAHLNPHAAPPPEGAAYGLCNGRDARALFHATVCEVIVPGLERLGLPARAAWQERHAA
ncbi:MAG: ferritin-like domain-containing protein [Myxococcales bacterium]|nr:ferritin-like domain-containing protein [Myxococcales bacterium]